jgi:signal peptidase I
MDTTWLELAKQSYQKNDRARARELLTGYVRVHGHDAEGWFWLAHCIENRSARIQYYQKALALQPDHAIARTELAALLPAPRMASGDRRTAPASSLTTIPEQLTRANPVRPAAIRTFSVRLMARTTFFVLSLLLAVSVGLAVIPMFLGMRPFVIMSGSMEPTISTGSVAITRPVPSEGLQVGDVIAFNPHPDSVLPTIHRIIRVEERQGTRYYTTRGDANTGDDTEMALPPTGLQVMGAIPWIGYAVFYAAQPAGTVLLVFIPLVLLAVLWIKDRVIGTRQPRTA